MRVSVGVDVSVCAHAIHVNVSDEYRIYICIYTDGCRQRSLVFGSAVAARWSGSCPHGPNSFTTQEMLCTNMRLPKLDMFRLRYITYRSKEQIINWRYGSAHIYT